MLEQGEPRTARGPICSLFFLKVLPVGVENNLPQSHGHAPLEHLPEATGISCPMRISERETVLLIHGTRQPRPTGKLRKANGKAASANFPRELKG